MAFNKAFTLLAISDAELKSTDFAGKPPKATLNLVLLTLDDLAIALSVPVNPGQDCAFVRISDSSASSNVGGGISASEATNALTVLATFLSSKGS